MRVLFVMRNHGYLRNYASTARLLASRGHSVIIGSRGREKHMAVDTDRYLAELSQEHPEIRGQDLRGAAMDGPALQDPSALFETRSAIVIRNCATHSCWPSAPTHISHGSHHGSP